MLFRSLQACNIPKHFASGMGKLFINQCNVCMKLNSSFPFPSLEILRIVSAVRILFIQSQRVALSYLFTSLCCVNRVLACFVCRHSPREIEKDFFFVRLRRSHLCVSLKTFPPYFHNQQQINENNVLPGIHINEIK